MIPTKVLTDHKALVPMFKTNGETGNSRVDKWIMELRSRFILHVEYNPGKSNIVADVLVRVDFAGTVLQSLRRASVHNSTESSGRSDGRREGGEDEEKNRGKEGQRWRRKREERERRSSRRNQKQGNRAEDDDKQQQKSESEETEEENAEMAEEGRCTESSGSAAEKKTSTKTTEVDGRVGDESHPPAMGGHQRKEKGMEKRSIDVENVPAQLKLAMSNGGAMATTGRSPNGLRPRPRPYWVADQLESIYHLFQSPSDHPRPGPRTQNGEIRAGAIEGWSARND
uniref:RT_RNaseH domain-containing protein n=1 Tax=Globodera pallida TaxID=36090 RepID=A0A183BI94_GLOPA